MTKVRYRTTADNGFMFYQTLKMRINKKFPDESGLVFIGSIK